MAEILSTLSANGDKGTPTNGGNYYTTMSDWWANQQQDLVAGGNTLKLDCYSEDPFPGRDGALIDSTTIQGGTSDLTNYVEISAAVGSEHDGVRRRDGGSGFEVASLTGASAILVGNIGASGHIRLSGIEISNDTLTAESLWVHSNFTNNDGIIFSDKILSTGEFPYENTSAVTAVRHQLRNSMLWNYAILEIRRADIDVENVTNIHLGTAGNSVFNDVRTKAINLVATGGANASWLSATLGFAGTTNNGSENGGCPGANPQLTIDPITAGVDFVNPALGDYSPASGGKLDETGFDNSGVYTTDVAGNTYVVPWPIGAYEIQGPAGPTFNGAGDSTLVSTSPVIGTGTFDALVPGVFNGAGDATLTGSFFTVGTGNLLTLFGGDGDATLDGAFSVQAFGSLTPADVFGGDGDSTLGGSFFTVGTGDFVPLGVFEGAGDSTLDGAFTAQGAGVFNPSGTEEYGIWFGPSTEVNNISFGNTPIISVYKGTTKIWPNRSFALAQAVGSGGSGGTGGSTVTTSTVSIGSDTASDRYVAVGVQRNAGLSTTFPVSATFNGVAMTKVEGSTTNRQLTTVIFLTTEAVPTGTTGSMVITWSQTTTGLDLNWMAWTIVGRLRDTATGHYTETSANPSSVSITSKDRGVIIGIASREGASGPPWTWGDTVSGGTVEDDNKGTSIFASWGSGQTEDAAAGVVTCDKIITNASTSMTVALIN